jgi:hypothetical protein
VENLLRVRDLLYRDGFTIAGAKKKLQRGDEPVVELAPAPEQEQAPASVPEIAEASSVLSPMALPVQDRDDTQSAATTSPRVREKLVALRSEVEAFLSELSSRR